MTRLSVTCDLEDLDLVTIALLRFAGAERDNQPEKAARASVLARELATTLNQIDPLGESTRPLADHSSRHTYPTGEEWMRVHSHRDDDEQEPST